MFPQLCLPKIFISVGCANTASAWRFKKKKRKPKRVALQGGKLIARSFTQRIAQSRQSLGGIPVGRKEGKRRTSCLTFTLIFGMLLMPRLGLKPSRTHTQTHLFNTVFSAGPPSTYRVLLYIDVGPNAKKNLPPTFHHQPLRQAANYHKKKHSRQSPSIYFGPREPALSTHLSICCSSPLPCLPACLRRGSSG